MQDKQAKIKKEKEMDAERIANIISKTKQEEDAAKADYLERKRAEQKKWKETLEAEMQFRKLQISIENTAKHSRTKEFNSYTLSPVAPKSTDKHLLSTLSSGILTTQALSTLPITSYSSPKNMFITAPTIEETNDDKNGGILPLVRPNILKLREERNIRHQKNLSTYATSKIAENSTEGK